MSVPTHLQYSRDHEWLEISADIGKVGITDFAADALGDIVYVLLPAEGATVQAGEPCGEVESTKSVSELYAPASGTVVAVNQEVVADPSLINTAPYAEGWLYRLAIHDASGLLSAAEYTTLIEGGAK